MRLFRILHNDLSVVATDTEPTPSDGSAARTGDAQHGPHPLAKSLTAALEAIRSDMQLLSRSPRHRFEFCDDEVLTELPATDADACTDVEQKEVLSRLQCHLDTLPEHLKSPLLMVAIDEMSYDEVASQLDIPIGTVRSRISRSRSMLRERFHEEGIPLARQSVV